MDKIHLQNLIDFFEILKPLKIANTVEHAYKGNTLIYDKMSLYSSFLFFQQKTSIIRSMMLI